MKNKVIASAVVLGPEIQTQESGFMYKAFPKRRPMTAKASKKDHVKIPIAQLGGASPTRQAVIDIQLNLKTPESNEVQRVSEIDSATKSKLNENNQKIMSRIPLQISKEEIKGLNAEQIFPNKCKTETHKSKRKPNYVFNAYSTEKQTQAKTQSVEKGLKLTDYISTNMFTKTDIQTERISDNRLFRNNLKEARSPDEVDLLYYMRQPKKVFPSLLFYRQFVQTKSKPKTNVMTKIIELRKLITKKIKQIPYEMYEGVLCRLTNIENLYHKECLQNQEN